MTASAPDSIQGIPGLLRAAPTDPAARALLATFAEETEQRYGHVFESVAAPQDTIAADGLVAPDGCLLVLDGIAVGGVRRLDDETGEIKRMFVAPEHRRQGHARRLLKALEDAARELGYIRVRLDTGPLQPEAASLYKSSAYTEIAPYNDYMPPGSHFFEKRL